MDAILQEEKAEWIIYVTDEGQSGHFKLVFGSGKKAGIIPKDNPPRIDHVGFGLVLGADGKRIRTRDMGAVCSIHFSWQAAGASCGLHATQCRSGCIPHLLLQSCFNTEGMCWP